MQSIATRKVYSVNVLENSSKSLSSSHILYRDKIYIIKDVILKLVEYGELTQTTLISFCGLNMKKHKHILDYLEGKDLIKTYTRTVGKSRYSSDILIRNIGLSRKQFYMRVSKMIEVGLVVRYGRRYNLTTLGKIVYDVRW
jgi:predicted transcriptional regulator